MNGREKMVGLCKNNRQSVIIWFFFFFFEASHNLILKA